MDMQLQDKWQLKPEKREEFLAALKKWGLVQLSDEGLEYFFVRI